MRNRAPHWYGGFSLVEMTAALLISALVVASVFGVFISQWRFHAAQIEIAETNDAARVALEVLATELRQVSPRLGDLYAFATLVGLGDGAGLETAQLGGGCVEAVTLPSIEGSTIRRESQP